MSAVLLGGVAKADPLAAAAKRKYRDGEQPTAAERRALYSRMKDQRRDRQVTLVFETAEQLAAYRELAAAEKQKLTPFLLENIERGVAARDHDPRLFVAMQERIQHLEEDKAYLQRQADELRKQVGELTNDLRRMAMEAVDFEARVAALAEKVGVKGGAKP